MVQRNRMAGILLFELQIFFAQRGGSLAVAFWLIGQVPGEHCRMFLRWLGPCVGGRTDDPQAITGDQIEVFGFMVFRGGDKRVESVFANIGQRRGIRGIVEDADREKRLAIDQCYTRGIEHDLRGRFRKRRERKENERDDRVLKHTGADADMKAAIQAYERIDLELGKISSRQREHQSGLRFQSVTLN